MKYIHCNLDCLISLMLQKEILSLLLDKDLFRFGKTSLSKQNEQLYGLFIPLHTAGVSNNFQKLAK